MFPSLSQLSLIGDYLLYNEAADNEDEEVVPAARADPMSRLEETERYFQYPELCSLLFYLRKTQVRIFTYRGVQEKREMRWTRSDETEDFRADCWTL